MNENAGVVEIFSKSVARPVSPPGGWVGQAVGYPEWRPSPLG